MAIISSHVLDSVTGDHAAGIRVQCFRVVNNGRGELVIDAVANEEGRISESVVIQNAQDSEFDLVFHSAAYYQYLQSPGNDMQIVRTVVVRVNLPDPNEKYHLPLMLSPHSYSIWWSGKQSQVVP